MDVIYLRSNIDSLINHMRVKKYSACYIKQVRSMTNHIIRQSEKQEWSSYEEVRAWVHSNENFSEYSRKDFQFCITIIERFDLYHEYPIHPVDEKQMTFLSHSIGTLDLLPLQQQMSEFETMMLEKGFSKKYTQRIKQFAARIIILARSIPWNSFEDIRQYYRNSNLTDGIKRNHISTINKMEAFLDHNSIPRRWCESHNIEDATPSLGNLNLYAFKDRLSELQQYMEEKNYSASYIRGVIVDAQKIIIQSGKVEWNSYQEILNWYRDQGHNINFLKNIRTVLGIMSSLHLHNIFPNNCAVPNPEFPRENMYQKLITPYKEIVDYVGECQKSRGLKPSSIHRGQGEVTSLFITLQNKGIFSLEEANEDVIMEHFRKRHNYSGRTSLHAVSRFIRDCIPMNPILFRRIDDYIPVFHRIHRNIQYLTLEECNAIQDALENMDNDLSLKQRAIGTILFYTGMRASDVANLKLDSVDLRKEVLRFTQTKTGKEVLLPLLPVVGNAIYDYCSLERPLSSDPALFLGHDAPFHSITATSVGYVVDKIMNRANVRMKPGDRRGPHVFRHRVATSMAENNIPLPVISATLGHSSPNSLDAYLSADIVHLRECALDLGNYVISEEVFDNVCIQQVQE